MACLSEQAAGEAAWQSRLFRVLLDSCRHGVGRHK